jgi:phage shock protein C
MADIKQLRRSRSSRTIAGVCGGLGQFFGIDPIWFRIGFILAVLPGGIPGPLLYVIGWVVIPAE